MVKKRLATVKWSHTLFAESALFTHKINGYVIFVIYTHAQCANRFANSFIVNTYTVEDLCIKIFLLIIFCASKYSEFI